MENLNSGRTNHFPDIKVIRSVNTVKCTWITCGNAILNCISN